MKEKQIGSNEFSFSPQERPLFQQLRQRPQMMERVQKILELADNADGPLKTADQIEELLIEEMRRLGSATMQEWAAQAEARVGQELKQQNPAVLSRKKNAEMVVCIWGGRWGGPSLEQSHPALPAAFARAPWGDSGKISAPGTGVDRFWLRAFLRPGERKRTGALWI